MPCTAKIIKDISHWVGYWDRARMVNFAAIQSEVDVATARKFCSCLKTGFMAEVTDRTLWAAIIRHKAKVARRQQAA